MLLQFALWFGSDLNPAGQHSTLPTVMAPSPGLKTSITIGPMGSSWHKLSGTWNRNSNGSEYSVKEM